MNTYNRGPLGIFDGYGDFDDQSGTSKTHNDIERQDAQIAMGMIVDATTLEEAQSIAAAFLEGAS